ncbi:MAG: DNA polymerase IV [Thermodesulfobacteriota bacterium]
MNSNRKIIHVDMDAFFASVEQLDNSELRGKPLIVGGDPGGRGVVAACSYEARRFGIHSAMSCARAYKLCPQALFVRPRKERYGEVSAQVMAIFHRATDLVEPLSFDEAFLDVTVNKLKQASATLLAEHVRKQIRDEVGLTASAGVSYNKFLAKVASDLNKPDGLSVITPDQAVAFLTGLKVGKFFGVGRVTEKKMHALGIRTGGDLRAFSRQDLIGHFGKAGNFFYDIVRGIDYREVKSSRIRKSLGTETTLSQDIVEMAEVENILFQLTAKVERSMMKKKLFGHTLTLKVRYHDFTTITRSVTSEDLYSDAVSIIKSLPYLLQNTMAGRKKIRLLGLTVSNFAEENHKGVRQLMLPFPAPPAEKRSVFTTTAAADMVERYLNNQNHLPNTT